MSGFLTLVFSLIFVGLVLIAAMHPKRSEVPIAELHRRSKTSKWHRRELQKVQAFSVVTGLLQVMQGVLLVALVLTGVGAFGWLWGSVAAFGVAVLYRAVGRIPAVRRLGTFLYARLEPWLLKVIERGRGVLGLLRGPSDFESEPIRQVHSREDLAELIAHSDGVIGKNEQKLIGAALHFFDTKVAEVMTPRSRIDFVKKSEFLGPLVLDELHALGHSRLPVVDANLDQVVGVLHLRTLLSLDIKRSTTAEKAMEKQVFYVHEDDSLEHTLKMFIKARHHLCIVVNQKNETVGLVTLEDVIEALIGQRIAHESDSTHAV